MKSRKPMGTPNRPPFCKPMKYMGKNSNGEKENVKIELNYGVYWVDRKKEGVQSIAIHIYEIKHIQKAKVIVRKWLGKEGEVERVFVCVRERLIETTRSWDSLRRHLPCPCLN